jgi:drug/metabolite transporter (DMT)-like permease
MNKSVVTSEIKPKPAYTFQAGIICGCILFTAASLQQVGLVHTSAGKAAFITGLYIVLVPILGIFLKHHTHVSIWLGVAVATIGLYFLCVTESFSIVNADLLELVGAFFWAAHILVIDHYTRKIDVLKLCIIQFTTCSVLSMAIALFYEKITLSGLYLATIPILYGGICSVGIAYTLQVVGQKHAKPSHAAIILSMETVFASLGGLLILQENLGFRGYMGCLLMLAGMLISQLPNMMKNTTTSSSLG